MSKMFVLLAILTLANYATPGQPKATATQDTAISGPAESSGAPERPEPETYKLSIKEPTEGVQIVDILKSGSVIESHDSRQDFVLVERYDRDGQVVHMGFAKMHQSDDQEVNMVSAPASVLATLAVCFDVTHLRHQPQKDRGSSAVASDSMALLADLMP